MLGYQHMLKAIIPISKWVIVTRSYWWGTSMMVDYLGDTPHSMDSDQRGQCDAYWQGRIQDLKLGVAQMDGEFQNTIIIVYIFQIRCTSHTIFIKLGVARARCAPPPPPPPSKSVLDWCRPWLQWGLRVPVTKKCYVLALWVLSMPVAWPGASCAYW